MKVKWYSPKTGRRNVAAYDKGTIHIVGFWDTRQEPQSQADHVK